MLVVTIRWTFVKILVELFVDFLPVLSSFDPPPMVCHDGLFLRLVPAAGVAMRTVLTLTKHAPSVECSLPDLSLLHHRAH